MTRTKNLQMSKLDLEKAAEPEIRLPTFAAPLRKEGDSRKTSTSVSLTLLKHLTVWIVTNCRKLLKRWEYQTILPVSWETCMHVRKQQLEPCMEKLVGSRLRKEYHRAVCCLSFCLTHMLRTSWEMLGWMSYKLESTKARETSTTLDMRMIPL